RSASGLAPGANAISTRGINRCRLAAKTEQPRLANRSRPEVKIGHPADGSIRRVGRCPRPALAIVALMVGVELIDYTDAIAALFSAATLSPGCAAKRRSRPKSHCRRHAPRAPGRPRKR